LRDASLLFFSPVFGERLSQRLKQQPLTAPSTINDLYALPPQVMRLPATSAFQNLVGGTPRCFPAFFPDARVYRKSQSSPPLFSIFPVLLLSPPRFLVKSTILVIGRKLNNLLPTSNHPILTPAGRNLFPFPNPMLACLSALPFVALVIPTDRYLPAMMVCLLLLESFSLLF